MSDDQVTLTDDDDTDLEFGGLTTTAPAEKEGVLLKWTNYIHGWQDRFVILQDGTLSYYKTENDVSFGSRGSMSLVKAHLQPHDFDELRFDISINDCVWYLRASSTEEREQWLSALEQQKADSGFGSQTSLRRHGSLMSLHSGASLASSSSFKKGRNLREKLAEMETFRDILCRQIDTLQHYFDACSDAFGGPDHSDVPDDELFGEDFQTPKATDSYLASYQQQQQQQQQHNNQPATLPLINGNALPTFNNPIMPPSLDSNQTIDFKGEAITFKATTAGILATMSHCIDLMMKREDTWVKRVEKEQDRRKRTEDAYKTVVQDMKSKQRKDGPDYEEGPCSSINEEEFYDAVELALDKYDEEQDNRLDQWELSVKGRLKYPTDIGTAATSHRLSDMIEIKVMENLQYAFEDVGPEGQWNVIHEDGDLKVYRRELEEDGVVMDPLKATHTMRGLTAHEMCHYFFNPEIRMEWEMTLESVKVLETLAEDTVVMHQIIKRIWPTAQRDLLFVSHIRKICDATECDPDTWMVTNISIDHPDYPEKGKWVRAKINVALVCQTVVEQPVDGSEVTRENISCRIIYMANVHPGGYAPASVLRAVYKREYPKTLKRFTAYVLSKTHNKPILY